MSKRPYEVCFLIGAPRSGTTWLSTALGAHPYVCCTESRLFGQFHDVVHDGPDAPPRVRMTMRSYVDSLATCFNTEPLGMGAGDKMLGAMAWSLYDLLHARTGAARIVEKITPYVGSTDEVVAGLREHFPEARVIRLVRDPRDVVVSGVMHWLGRWSGNGPSDAAQRRSRWLLEGDADSAMDRLLTDAEIDDWIGAWLEPTTINADLDGAYLKHRLTYESMLVNQADALRDLFAFLGLATGERSLARCLEVSAFDRMSGGRRRGEDAPGRHVRKGVAGDWRNWLTTADGERIWALAGSALAQEGYETDDSWVSALPERLESRPANIGL